MTYDEAAEHLRESRSSDGGLYNLGWYLGWNPGAEEATLDGVFTARDLEAIAAYMRGR
jgi:hypothetical protein